MKYFYIAFLIFNLICLDINAQISQPNKVVINHVNEEITIDGNLNEGIWNSIQAIENFTQREPEEGTIGTETTKVKMFYTDEAIYLGIYCNYSFENMITSKFMNRDFPYWEDDNFEVIFDTYHDKRNGYVFVINPNGARSDVQVTDEGRGFNIDWNGIWDAASVIKDNVWYGEIKIPFSTLKFSDDTTQIWGINFERNIRAKNETQFWQGWSRNYDFEHVSHAGELHGLSNIRGKESIELKPFLSLGYGIDNDKTKDIEKIGGDINLSLSPQFRLNATINTDFSQVESDRAKISLSRFSIFYPEKREFFLEGKDFFAFNLNSNASLLYTRRIGIQNGEEVPVLGGVRLVGKQNSTSIGLMSLQTENLIDDYTTNYTALRIKQDLFASSNVGMLITAKNTDGNYNYVWAFDANYKMNDFLTDKNLFLRAMISNSYSKNQSNPDELLYGFILSYPNDLLAWDIMFINLPKNYNPEMGFLDRANVKQFYSNIGWKPWVSLFKGMRRLLINPAETYIAYSNETHELETATVNITPFGIETDGFDQIRLTLNLEHQNLNEDFQILNNLIIPKGKYDFKRVTFQIESNPGKIFNYYTNLNYGEFYSGTLIGFIFNANYNLNNHVNLALEYDHNYIELAGSFYNTDNIGFRFNYAFNPKMNFLIYNQWNNSSNEYILNFRFHWIPTIGSDLYVVYNLGSDTSPIYKNRQSIILAKYVYRLGC